MQVLAIDETLFRMAFNRDVDVEIYPQSAYLDHQTGEIRWVYENDEHAEMEDGIPAVENKATRQRITETPDRFLEIPGLNHDDHHKILQEFLASDWTKDKEAESRAYAAYSGSIGGWIQRVNDDRAIHSYYDFRDGRTKELAEEFLRRQGIKPQWK